MAGVKKTRSKGALSKSRGRRGKSIRYAAGIIVTAIIVWFLGAALARNWQSLMDNMKSFSWGCLAASVLLLALAQIFNALIWKDILKRLKARLGMQQALKIRSVSELGRYTPGKIWHVLGRTYFAKRMGIPSRTTLASIFIELLFTMLSAALVFLIFSPDVLRISKSLVWPAAIIVILAVLLMRFDIFTGIMDWAVKKLKKRNYPATLINLPFAQKLKLLAFYSLNWGFMGGSFFFVIKAFYAGTGYDVLPAVIGGYSIAWVIGFLTFLTPGGLGVREGLLTLILSHMGIVPVSIAVVAPVMMRLVSIGVNALMAVLTLGVDVSGRGTTKNRRGKKRKHKKSKR